MPHRCFFPAPFSAALVALAFFTPALVSPVRAQQEQAADRAAATAPFSPPTTLAAGLKNMEWRAAQRGPLFAVNPQGTSLWRPKRDPHLPPDAEQVKADPLGPPDGSRSGYRPETLAPFFGRKLTRCGSVTVFAPTEMTLLATNLKGSPDPLAGLRRDEKIKILQASLSDAQWKQMGSAAGLGAGEMEATQRDIYLSLLPDPFIVTEWAVEKSPGTAGNDSGMRYTAPKKTTLVGAERMQIRLRMNRTTSMRIPSTNDKNGGYGQYVSTQTENQSMVQVSHPNEYGVPDAFGVLLKDTVPARLKPGHLAWDAPALDADVDLRGAKTVGELVTRLGKASGLELIADARVAALPLWVYGDPVPTAAMPRPGTNVAADAAKPAPDTTPSTTAEPAPARAGDVLKALCWAVTGTIRKVGPVYLLTDDLEGIGTRQARISRWTNDGNARKWQILAKYDPLIRAHQPLQYTGFAPNDPAALDAATTTKVEAGWQTSAGRYRGVTQPTAELPDAQQKMVRKAIESYQMRASRGEKNLQPIVLDKVQVSMSTKMMYVLPNGTEANCDIYLSLSAFLPPPAPASWDGKPLPSTDPVKLPPVLGLGGIAQVSPRTMEEVRLVLEAAKEKGLRGLWIAVDGLDGKPLVSPDLLKQAVQMGKEKGVPVSAVVRLLLAPGTANNSDGDTRNVSVTGETGAELAALAARIPERFPGANLRQTLYSPQADWLRPDALLVPVLVKRRLLDIANTPGLAGIIVKNAAAPGYREKEASPYGDTLGSDFGYTLENRVACLRSAHVDPIDMGSSEMYGDTSLVLPFFAEGRGMTWTDDGTMKMDKKVTAPRTTWKTLRLEQNVKFLSGLFQSFRAAQPTMPLYIADFDEGYGNSTVIAWEKADALPVSTPYDYSNEENNLSSIAQARKLSKTVLMDIYCGYSVMPRYPDSFDDGIAPGSGKAFARVVNQFLRPIQEIKNVVPGSHPTWDGVVLDFGELPAATAADLLKNGMVSATAPGPKTAVNR